LGLLLALTVEDFQSEARMPDHKEMGREPTERERETTFAPHQSPSRQGDGDPGVKRPRLDPQDGTESADGAETGDTDNSDPATNDVAGDRGKWQKS
jgi:hypothetical protein